MKLIYKEYYLTLACFYLVKYGFEPLLKFASVLCTSNKSAHIEREYRAVFKIVGHVAAHYTLRKPLGNSRFTDTRFTYKAGVVLCLS